MVTLYEDAVTTFEQALTLSDREPALHSNLAEAYYYLGRFDLSVRHLRKAVTLDPDRKDDARMLRRVVAMEVLASARCSRPAPKADQIQATLADRFRAEGLTNPKQVVAELLKDRAAMSVLEKRITNCQSGK
jgi:tetratricopeptide (TPR) repeat protein